MKLFLPLLARLNEAAVTLNVETFTDFQTSFQIEGTDVPLTFEHVLKASFKGDGKASMDLFQGKFWMVDSGQSRTVADCTSPYAKYNMACNEPFLSTTMQHGAGQIFIDATTGKFGVQSHFTAAAGQDASIQGSFCAVVNVPVKSYPPPSMLKSKINAAGLQRAEDNLNRMPHTEHDGIATFHSPKRNQRGYRYGDSMFEIQTDGGAIVKSEVIEYEPDHKPYTHGWAGEHETYHRAGSASITFTNWTSPAANWMDQFTVCPGGSTTNLHAHPEATRSLASLNAVVQMLRQHDDLGWLPEDPAAFFMEQLEQQGQEQEEYDRDEQQLDAESEDAHWTPMVASLLAGVVSGGGVVLALFNLAKKKQRQVPLLSDA